MWQLQIPYVPLYSYWERLAIGASDGAAELQSAYAQLAGSLALPASDGRMADVSDRLQRVSLTSPATIASVFNIPAPVPDFTGRDELLDEIRTRFRWVGTVVLAGLPGAGKTALAREHAQRYQSELDLAFWIDAKTHGSLAAGYASLAHALGLVPAGGGGALEAVRNWLERNERWLLVIDDAPELDAIQDFLPRVRHGQCLITSRNRAFFGADDVIPVGPLRRPDSVQLLLRRSGNDDDEAAAALAEEVHDFPLALVLVANYARTTARSLGGVLDLLRQHSARLLAEAEAPLAQTIEAIGAESPEAVELLTLCAFMGREEIPVDDLLSGAKTAPPRELASLTADPFAIDDMVAALRRYSVVERGRDGLRVPPIVQAAARNRLTPEIAALWSARTLALVARAADKESMAAHVRPTLATAERAVAAVDAVTPISVETLEWLSDAASAFHGARSWSEAVEVERLARPLAVLVRGNSHELPSEAWRIAYRFIGDRVIVGEIDGGQRIAAFTGDFPMRCCAVDPSGQCVAAGDDAGGVRVVRLVGQLVA